MPQSLVKNYIHIVLFAKHRQSLISPPFEIEFIAIWLGHERWLENPIIAGGTPIMFTSCVCFQKKYHWF
jgi:hypothetical protein